MNRAAVASAVVVVAVSAGWCGVVALAVAGAMGAELPAWWAALCGVAGFAIAMAVYTPRRP